MGTQAEKMKIQQEILAFLNSNEVKTQSMIVDHLNMTPPISLSSISRHLKELQYEFDDETSTYKPSKDLIKEQCKLALTEIFKNHPPRIYGPSIFAMDVAQFDILQQKANSSEPSEEAEDEVDQEKKQQDKNIYSVIVKMADGYEKTIENYILSIFPVSIIGTFVGNGCLIVLQKSRKSSNNLSKMLKRLKDA